MRATTILLSLFILSIGCMAFAGPFDIEGTGEEDPRAWATGYVDYLPAADVDPVWCDPTLALGPATGKNFDVVSLGELDAGSKLPAGQITLTFDVIIENGEGADFAVFENSFPTGDVLFADLAYVEVSSDGETFVRFPSVSLTPQTVDSYGTIIPTDVYNLAGAHPNAYGSIYGTPFDLFELTDLAPVQQGQVDLSQILYVRIVDVPGSGEFLDQATQFGYDQDHPIYDPYPTLGSGGFDLEAVGVLNSPDFPIDGPISDDDDSDDDDNSDDDDSDDDDSADSQNTQAAGCGI